jgi:hypothetical protein
MKVLLLDTAFSSAPIYDYLVRAGHEVWVMGNRHADLLAMQAGSNWIQQDYSQVLEVEKHVLRHGIEYVVPGCTDVSIDVCLQLNMNPDLHDTAEVNGILSNKALFRNLCVELALPAPRVIPKENFPLQGRFICKPVDAFSGRGITIFNGNDGAALEAAYAIAREASPTSTALIETFEAGELYSCSAFVDCQRISTAFYVREGSSANPFAVDTSYIDYGLPPQCAKPLVESLEKLCAALRLKDGLLHTQFILTETNLSIVEVARRCPGDLYSLLIEFSSGFAYAAQYASYFVGAKQESKSNQQRNILRHTVTSAENTIFGGLRLGASNTVTAYFPTCAMGQILLARQGNRAGILFCESATREQLLQDYQIFISRKAYDVF